jgi:hypothetical protein
METKNDDPITPFRHREGTVHYIGDMLLFGILKWPAGKLKTL